MPVAIVFELFCFKFISICSRMISVMIRQEAKPLQNRNYLGIAPV